MNLQKAIEIKEIYHNCHSQSMTPDERSADNISIEAIKQVHKDRFIAHPYCLNSLPGETED